MERFAEDAALLAKVRDYLWKNAHLVSTVVSGKEEEGAKFRDYFDHHEPIATVPSHRALAMFRGRNEGVLQLSLNALTRSLTSRRKRATASKLLSTTWACA